MIARSVFLTFAISGFMAMAQAAPSAPSPKAPIVPVTDVDMPVTMQASCPAQVKQGGLVVCTGPAGASVYKNAELVTHMDASGIAAIGIETSEPEGLRISIDSDAGAMRDFDIQVEPRTDEIRYLSGLDCDKVDARTEDQKAHAARSWETKAAGFARYEAPTVDAIYFAKPASGPFSSPFGPKRHYSGTSKATGASCTKVSVHRGLDMAVATGTDLLAPLGGTITLADPVLYYEGGAIFLDHGWGLISVFMHLSAVDVEPGQTVKTGERLGATGNTGRTTGPHLHWAVKWRPTEKSAGDGFYIDPAILLTLEEVRADGDEQDTTD